MALTLTTLGAGRAEAQPRHDELNRIVRDLARELDLPVADVTARMSAAALRGETLHSADGIHLTFAGYRALARAVLDALGHPDVAVPTADTFAPPPLPGLIRDWKVRVAPNEQPSSPCGFADFADGGGWREIRLPMVEPVADDWWLDQERRRGLAVRLDKLLGGGRAFQGIAEVESPAERDAWLHTGAMLKTVWLNGEKVYGQTGWTGWHPGKERIPVRLRKGGNRIAIESSHAFAVCLTNERVPSTEPTP